MHLMYDKNTLKIESSQENDIEIHTVVSDILTFATMLNLVI